MNTQLIPSANLQLNSIHVSQYYKVHNASVSANLGVQDGTTQLAVFWDYTSLNLIARINQVNGFQPGNFNFTKGLAIASRTSSTLTKYYNRNNSPLQSSVVSSILPNFAIYLSTTNNSGTPGNINPNTLSFTSIGDGITDIDALNLNTSIETFQTTLSRQAI
jgi:hypothetical protein